MERSIRIGRIYKSYDKRYVIVDSIFDNFGVQIALCHNVETGESFNEPVESFLALIPEDERGKSPLEYKYELADVVHTANIKVRDKVVSNDGFCPCKIKKTEDTRCMCKEFREMMTDGKCHCGLYKKTWLGDQM